MLARGTIIEGQYEVREERSRIADEVLFAGRRLSDQTDVDIRVVAPDAPANARKQFSAMANILGRLDHPNCLSALGAGQMVDRALYTVTRALNGGPIQSLVGENVPARVLAEIGKQLTAGLEHLHSQGIVLGCVTPAGVVLGEQYASPVLQIVDFSFARIMVGNGPRPECKDNTYLAPEVVTGGEANESSDVFSAGKVLRALVSASTPPALLETIERMASASTITRISAREARMHFESWIAADPEYFDLGWVPEANPTAISTGVFSLVDAPAAQAESSEMIMAARLPEAAASAAPVVPPPATSRRGIAMGLAAAGIAAAALVGYVVMTGEPTEASEAGVASAAAVAGTANAADAPAERRAPVPPAAVPVAGAPEGAQPLDGNPIVWLAQVNRQDLGAVLPFRERTRLLEELATRRGVNDRVNHRWNAMLDLWQAGDSERPCATFAAALASLEGAPSTEAERDLIRRVVVPTPAPGSAAGVAPDDSCVGLEAAFEAYVPTSAPSSSSSRKRSSKRRASSSTPAPAAAPVPAPKAKAKPAKPSSVATKLDEDLRDL
ncbi:MAG: protein kinase [Myxococcota bacterium]